MGALVFLALVALASGAANDNSTSLASNEKSSPIIIVSNNSTLPTSQAESSLNTTGEGTNSDVRCQISRDDFSDVCFEDLLASPCQIA